MEDFGVKFLLLYAPHLLLASVGLGMMICGLFLAANHTWSNESGSVGKLILVGVRTSFEKSMDYLDKVPVAGFIKGILIFLTVTGILGYAGHLLFMTGNKQYLWAFFLTVGYVSVPKTFRELGEMFLSCFRCMPTFWLGIPAMGYVLVKGLVLQQAEYMVLVPIIIGLTSLVSYVSTMAYMVYANSKVSIEQSAANRDYTLQMRTARKASVVTSPRNKAPESVKVN